MGEMPASYLPPSLSQIKDARIPLQNPNAVHDERLSGLERLAIAINDHIGTPGFFFIIICWTILWLSWNVFAPKELKFDPPMAFVLWLFLSNCLQIFLMPLIMVAQNLQDRHAQLRVESDYLVNVKAEREIEFLFRHLEYQNAVLMAIGEKLQLDMNEILSTLKTADDAPEAGS